MGHHRLRGLAWAVACDRPAVIPKSRPRGAKAAGLRYEKELAKALPAAKHGQWWEFRDQTGRHFCQTDLVLELREQVLVLEVKYTWTQQGHSQLQQLYLPLVEHTLARTFPKKNLRGVVVCRALTSETPKELICRTLLECLTSPHPTPVLHWHPASGLGPLALPPTLSHLAPKAQAA